MANNTRALTLKKNAEEFDQKLSDIKRLVGVLKSFIKESISATILSADTIEASDEIGWMRIRFQYHDANRDVTFEVNYNELRLDADRKYDLRSVRQMHDNLDVLIKLAESICDDAGVLRLFKLKMARFEVW